MKGQNGFERMRVLDFRLKLGASLEDTEALAADTMSYKIIFKS